MMRALAEFIMRGRPQAGVVAVLGYVIPLLGSLTVALVTLRKGVYEGGVVLALALLPAILSLIFDNSVSIVMWVTVLSLIVVYLLSLVLRATVSLSFTVMSTLFASAAVAGLIWLLMPDAIDRVVESLSQQMGVTREAGAAESIGVIFSHVTILGLIACMLVVNGIVSVLVGRWLQAMLFNPGGFGEELRSLRLGLAASVICFAGSALIYFQGHDYLWWSYLLAIPLLLVALAIAHSVTKARGLPLPWLILYYFMTIAFMPVVVCIGFVDVWVNFRNRLAEK